MGAPQSSGKLARFVEAVMLRRLAMTAAIATAIFPSIATAQIIDLLCYGSMTTYNPLVEGNVAATATRIDLENRQIATPVGSFPIQSISDVRIAFGQNAPEIINGSFDRVSERLTIMWQTPEQYRQTQAGGAASMKQYAELRCAPARRLF